MKADLTLAVLAVANVAYVREEIADEPDKSGNIAREHGRPSDWLARVLIGTDWLMVDEFPPLHEGHINDQYLCFKHCSLN